MIEVVSCHPRQRMQLRGDLRRTLHLAIVVVLDHALVVVAALFHSSGVEQLLLDVIAIVVANKR